MLADWDFEIDDGNGFAAVRYVFSLQVSGSITCKSCPTETWPQEWCAHLRDAMTKHWDAKAIWHSPRTLDPQWFLEIPVFPTTDMWTPIILTYSGKGDIARWTVEWDMCPTSNDTVYICTLNEGEGREVIRRSLVQYMLGDPKRTKECKAGHHNTVAEIRFNHNSIQEKWSIYTTGWCIYCVTNNPASAGDLVPDKQGAGITNATSYTRR